MRLIYLLREHRIGLAEAHQIATDFVDGQRVTVVFERAEDAQRFLDDVGPLGVDAFIANAVAAAG